MVPTRVCELIPDEQLDLMIDQFRGRMGSERWECLENQIAYSIVRTDIEIDAEWAVVSAALILEFGDTLATEVYGAVHERSYRRICRFLHIPAHPSDDGVTEKPGWWSRWRQRRHERYKAKAHQMNQSRAEAAGPSHPSGGQI